MASLLSELINLGLSDKEARVYLASLELGPSSVAQIATEAEVNRATTYVILESLSQLGLVGKFDEDKKTYYAASGPETLESIFEVQKKEIDERRKLFNKVLPQLRLIDNQKSGKPIVKFYEGQDGTVSSNTELYGSAEVSEKGEPIRMIYPRDMVPKIFSQEELEAAVKIRLNRKIKSKVLCTTSGEVKNTLDGERLKIDSKKFPVSADINIYGDTVRIASLGKKLTSILIKDRDIADTMKSLFDLAWEAAKDKHKKK